MERPGKNIWSHLSLEKKILLAVTLMILTLFISNIFIYLQVNKIAGKMDTVYASNVNLSELSEALEHVQLLERVMTAHGFAGYAAEWWHFSDTDEYPVNPDFTPPR